MSTGTAVSRELYVYWKATSAERAMAAVRQAQGTLESEHAGLQARVLRREEPGAASATVMEIYTRTGGIDSRLHSAIEERLGHATNSLREGLRHTEVFVSD